jgi:hypothetical protein
MNVRNISPILK